MPQPLNFASLPSIAPLRQATKAGFTLIEMAVVLAIIALVLGGGLANFVAYTEQKGLKNAQARLQHVQQTLIEYGQIYGRLPCPADITGAQDNANFALESGDPGECEPANFQYSTDDDVVAGLIPVRDIGLEDDMAFDSWGNRVLYMIDRRFTNIAGLTQHGPNSQGKIIVQIQGSTTNTANAAFALLSYGANRHGAYGRGGGTIRTSGRDPAATVGSLPYWTWELENCDCDDGTAANGTFDDTLIQAPFSQGTSSGDDVFDDIVVYSTRAQIE